MADYIKSKDVVNALWKALYSYEDKTEKQFIEDPNLKTEEWFGYRIFVQACHAECLEEVLAIPSVDIPQWISVEERLPKCEQEVLICTEKKLVGRNAYIDSIVTPAIYEDGTMRENESKWRWEDIDWAGWDEEEDCGIIPEGWWENRHFNPDDVYNNPVDRKVVAWMPLPEPPKEETDG